MKRFFAVFLVCILALGVGANVCARGNVLDIIEGRQNLLLFATVEDFSDGTVLLDPYGVMTSSGWKKMLDDEQILVDTFYYTYCPEHSDMPEKPVKGDNIVISLNRNGSRYVLANGAYKVSSLDYKLLTIHVSEKTKGQDCLENIVMLVEYIHSNGEVYKFNEEDGVITAEIEGNSVQIYPTDKIMNYVSFVNSMGEVVEAIKTKDVIEGGTLDENAYDVNVIINDNRWLLAIGVILLGLLIGGIFAYKSAIKEVVIKRKRGR